MTGGSRSWATLLAAAVIVLCGAHGAAPHPLDPLSADEISSAVAVLRAAGMADVDTRFPLIDLDEPDKARVLAWQPGQVFGRRAFVVARRARTVYEGVVDLAARDIVRWQAIPGVQPSLLVDELESAQHVVTQDPGWRAAMEKRGYTRFDELFCAPLAAGYFAEPAEENRRLLKVTCFDTAGTRINVWGRPIEGLYAVVDLDERKVIRLIDTGQAPVSRETGDFSGAPEAAAASVPAAGGQNFTLNGNEVRWKNWTFHFRMDRRVGPILSLVSYDDRDRRRMVLYRGSLSEMFVPYMDPDSG